jgi:hypothetical protein
MLHCVTQTSALEWLHDVIRGVNAKRLHRVLIVRRHKHHEWTMVRRQSLRDRQSVYARHRDVEDYEIGRFLSYCLKCVATVVAFTNDTHRRNLSEEADHALARRRLVVDEQHA